MDADASKREVTIALLGSKIDNLTDKITGFIERQEVIEAVVHAHDTQIAVNAERLATACERISGRFDRIEDKQRGWYIFLGGLTALGSAIATWLGTRATP